MLCEHKILYYWGFKPPKKGPNYNQNKGLLGSKYILTLSKIVCAFRVCEFFLSTEISPCFYWANQKIQNNQLKRATERYTVTHFFKKKKQKNKQNLLIHGPKKWLIYDPIKMLRLSKKKTMQFQSSPSMNIAPKTCAPC